MTKSERMESQARVIFRAIRDARERGMIDEDESFFYPYPEGVPPKDQHGKDTVWLNLGADPEAWGREIPTVKDRWLEVLSLGLAKEITPQSEIRRPMSTEEEADAAERLASQDPLAFEDLVEDYDLEDHERLEQLGDSIVNMSSRLLAYQSFPDVNEGSLTRLSNYPTQNNFLALLFQECGLAARRDELRDELRGAPEADAQDAGDGHPNDTAVKMAAKALEGAEEKEQLPSLIKRDADMFEAYAAAVFLSHGNDFNVVHAWLSHLFRPFQDQAYRFMVQRSEALAKLQAARAADANASSSSSFSFLNRGSLTPSATNIAADGLGIKSASVDPSSVSLTALFPDFMRAEKSTSPIPTHVLQGGSEAFITDEFLTVAARARRQREERLREELRLQDQRELMNMGWFRKGFLNLSKGFRQYVMGKDVVREEELRMRERIHQQRGLSEKDRERLRARERSNAGISIKSTGSKTRTKITGIQEHAPFKKE
jgi:dsRNA-specific ribonuclease